MKIRYVIDIDVDCDYENLDELQFKLKDELVEYVKNSELGYYADKISVKLQDDYCIKEEKKLLKAGRKALDHQPRKAVHLMRDRLIELLDKNYMFAEDIADHLLENGVIVPPCKVGQTVYKISYRKGSNVKYVEETTICRIAIDNEGIWLFCSCNPIVKCKFGKLVFLTKEEAEQALKGGAE